MASGNIDVVLLKSWTSISWALLCELSRNFARGIMLISCGCIVKLPHECFVRRRWSWYFGELLYPSNTTVIYSAHCDSAWRAIFRMKLMHLLAMSSHVSFPFHFTWKSSHLHPSQHGTVIQVENTRQLWDFWVMIWQTLLCWLFS